MDTFFESIDQLANSLLGEADWDRLPELFSSQKDCLIKVLQLREGVSLHLCDHLASLIFQVITLAWKISEDLIQRRAPGDFQLTVDEWWDNEVVSCDNPEDVGEVRR